jgi:1-acyl-sn-glycerol-3-phosphate acyltransferase
MGGIEQSAAPAQTAPMRPWYRFCRIACQTLFLAFFRGRVFGTSRVPRTGGVLLVCNHQSFLDPVLATLALPRECHYMARDSLFHNPFFRRLIESLNAFPIKRGTADLGAIKETLRRLKAGALVVTFPEATRTPDGSLQPMAPGVILLARKARVPLVPAAIMGAFESWPRHARLPRPHPVVIAYGQPLSPDTLANLPDDACIAEVRRRIQELMDRFGARRRSS